MRITRGDTEDTSSSDRLPNCVTIEGRGVPGNFEVTVAGELETEAEVPLEDGLVVSGNSIEGSIEVGVQRIWFSGTLVNLEVRDRDGVAASESDCAPGANITYNAQ